MLERLKYLRKEIMKAVSRGCSYGLFDCTFKMHASENHSFYQLKAEPQSLAIFTGDSRMAGAVNYGTWNDKLNLSLPILNLSVGGTRSEDWDNKISIQGIINNYPKMVLYGVGGNDLASGMSYQAIIGSLQKIIFTLKYWCPETKIYIHCCLPILYHGKATNKKVRELNRQLKILCINNNIHFINFFEEFNKYYPQSVDSKFGTIEFTDACNIFYLNMDEVPPYMRDYNTMPVHFNQNGYNRWFYLLNEYFKKH